MFLKKIRKDFRDAIQSLTNITFAMFEKQDEDMRLLDQAVTKVCEVSTDLTHKTRVMDQQIDQILNDRAKDRANPKVGETWQVEYKTRTFIGYVAWNHNHGKIWYSYTPDPELVPAGHPISELKFIRQI